MCLDRAGLIGLYFSSPVFVLWASWGPLETGFFPRTIPKDTSTGNFNDLECLFEILGCPEASHWSPVSDFLVHISESQKLIDLGELWAKFGQGSAAEAGAA